MGGGIFMASNVEKSCALYDVIIQEPHLVAKKGGDIEYLRPLCGPPHFMEANAIYWMTDRTPHESLPLPVGTKRQYFRLVAGPITHWFANHSTANPHCELPKDVQVIIGDKFRSVDEKKLKTY